MKKLLLIIGIIVYSTSYAQNTNLRATTIKETYENVFYRSPQKYNQQIQIFKVNSIEFHTSFIGSESKNMYQIKIEGMVNNTKEEILHNAGSIEELEYFINVFKGRYKKILLFESENKVGTKKYYNTSIVVEY